MLAVRDAYQTAKGNVVVRDKKGKAWVLSRDWFDTSMTRNEQLSEAINLFIRGTLVAFEEYDEERHGPLGGGIICLSR